MCLITQRDPLLTLKEINSPTFELAVTDPQKIRPLKKPSRIYFIKIASQLDDTTGSEQLVRFMERFIKITFYRRLELFLCEIGAKY